MLTAKSIAVAVTAAFAICQLSAAEQATNLIITIITESHNGTPVNSTVAPSFCELCRDEGNCAKAFKGGPGIFCGAWLNAASQRMACCCQANGQCAKTQSNYECMCRGGHSKPNGQAAALGV